MEKATASSTCEPGSTLIQSWAVLAIHIIALALVAIFAFSHNPGLLLEGNDGPTSLSLAEEQQFFFGITPHLHSNILEGLGNISFPFNLSMLPGFWLSKLNLTSTFTATFIYSWFALQLFVTVLLIGWNHGFTSRVNYAASWLLTILAFPFFENWRLYPITANSPEFLTIITLFALMDIGIYRMGRDTWLKTILYGSLLLLGLALGLMICPANFVILLPILLMTTIYSFKKVSNKGELIRKLTMGLIILALVITAGWIEYIGGLMLNTIATFFNTEMKSFNLTLDNVSILFQDTIPDRKIGTWFFCFATLSTIVTIWHSSRLRSIAILVLLAQFSIVGGGLTLMHLPKPWTGPAPVYCELLLFPFYALFIAHFLGILIKKIIEGTHTFKWLNMAYYPFIAVVVITMSIILSHKNIIYRSGFALEPSSTVITDILEKEIAFHQSTVFAGRVANIIPTMDWMTQFQYFDQLNKAVGNDHQTTGLWLKHIPTLHEYNELITPGFFRLYRRFLSDGTDAPYRSWSSFNLVNLKILKLLGVRFILTTIPHIDGTTHRAQINFQGKIPSLYLLEITNPNIGNISANRIVSTYNVHETEELLAAKDFNIHNAIVTRLNVNSNDHFVPATQSTLSIEKGGFHLQATSKGKTLLILPIEFSHCLHITPLSGTNPQVIRVDIALTGIIFDQQVNVAIDNRTGPFANPRCRWQDYREFSYLWKK